MSAHYVYSALAGGRALYVGMTKNPGARLAQHARGSEWFNRATRITFDMHDTKAAAAAEERALISLFKPLYNVQLQGNPKPARTRRTPPHVPLSAFRQRAGMTVVDLSRELFDLAGFHILPSSLSDVESGHKESTPELLDALCRVYGLPSGTFTADFVPHNWPAVSA